MTDVLERARAIRLLVTDVDGVMTDGTLYFTNTGDEIKGFSVQDGLGIKLLQAQGIMVAIITGRQSSLLARRAENLGIDHLIQGREDKLAALHELQSTLGIGLQEIAYLGDDLPDLAAICQVRLGMTVANGHPFVARHAHWQSRASGGHGALREAAEFILEAQGKLDAALSHYL